VTREELRTALWGENTFIEFDQGLNTCVRQIRTVLGDNADAPRFIETLPRRGYRLIVPVDRVVTPATPPPAAHPEPAAVPEHPTPWLRAGVAATAALAVVAGALIGIPWAASDPQPAPGNRSVTVAVLPLTNISKDPEQDYLADGVTEALIHDLAQIRALRVISRTSVMRFKNTTQPLGNIAQQLGAGLVVEGSFQQSGDRVRLTLQLIDAATDQHLFSRAFETTADRLFDTQRQIARQLAEEVTTELMPGERRRLAAQRSVAPEAYRNYLMGRHFWNLRGRDNLRIAEGHFKRAVEIDPSFAQGYAALAETYVLLGDEMYAGMPMKEGSTLTHEYASRALALDPGQGEALAARAMARTQFDWDWDAAEQDFKAALELSPQSATVHAWYGWLLVARGRFDEAIDTFERASLLDPLSLSSVASTGDAYMFAGRLDEAMARYDAALKLDPDYLGAHFARASVMQLRGQYKDALAVYEQILATGFNGRAWFAATSAMAELGDMAGARARLAQMKKSGPPPRPMTRASTAFILNDYDAAFAALNEAADERSNGLLFLVSGPTLNGFKNDPRFIALVTRVNPELLTIDRPVPPHIKPIPY
jgi:TolB-like protein/Tfp pilus assembly protein PilF